MSKKLKRMSFVLVTFSLIFSMSIYALATAQESTHTNDDELSYDYYSYELQPSHCNDECNECSEAGFLDNVEDIIDLGDGYIVIVTRAVGLTELSADLSEEVASALANIPKQCCSRPALSTTSQMFHTVRTVPPPRFCSGRTMVTTTTCTNCWVSGSTTSNLSGCGAVVTCL
jgi:hypothetical protein